MYPVSDRFLAAAAAGGDYVVVADVYRAGAKLNDEPLPVVDGEATGTYEDVIRWSTDIVFADDTGGLVPTKITDPLSPNGPELRVRAGFRFEDDTRELAPVGWFRITRSRSEFGRVQCTAFDLAYTLGTPLSQPYAYDGGLPVEDVIAAIARKKNPTISVRALITNELTVPGVCDLHDVPIEFIRKLAFAAGADAYFDRQRRQLIIAPLVSTPAAVAEVDFVEGDKRDKDTATEAVFWDEGREIDSENVPSVCVVEANHSSLSAPLRVTVRDTSPRSPTNANGSYGEVTTTITTDKASTQAQCVAIGRAELARMAWAETYDWSALPNPALDVAGTVSITRPRLKLSHKCALVSAMRLPLTPGQMRLKAAERRVLDSTATQD